MRRFLDSLGYPIEVRNMYANYSREKTLKVENCIVQSDIDLIAIDSNIALKEMAMKMWKFYIRDYLVYVLGATESQPPSSSSEDEKSQPPDPSLTDSDADESQPPSQEPHSPEEYLQLGQSDELFMPATTHKKQRIAYGPHSCGGL